jgi:preprotein translocase subunit SecG
MQVLNIFHVLIAIALIGFVLIQRGQGATAGAAFGSGASGTVFGARGAGNFLSRSTWVLAVLFCAISLTMAVLVSHMMQTSEPDLGVVVATEPAAQEQVPAEELSVGPGEAQATDMPAFEQAIEPAGEQVDESVDGPVNGLGGAPEAGDTPPLEAEAAEAAASEAAEDVPAAEGGRDEPQPAGDDS